MDGEDRRQEDDDTSSKLTDEDKLACAQVVQEYLAGRVADPITAGEPWLYFLHNSTQLSSTQLKSTQLNSILLASI
jgi:hypothetical protein